MIKKSRLMAFGLAFAAILTFMSQSARCDVIGSTYTVGGTVWADDGGLTAGAFADDGTGAVTFDGTTKVIGNLNFGVAGDEMLVQETQTLAADGITFTIDVFLFAQDAAGNLTTWTAAGATVDHDGDPLTDEIPRSVSFFDLASFNGGTDALDVNIAANETYTFVDSNSFVVTTAGSVFGFTDPSDPVGGIATGEFTASVGFGSDGDLAEPVAVLNNEAIAGYGFSWTYTIVAVPEPASTAGLMFLGVAGLVSRRRQS